VLKNFVPKSLLTVVGKSWDVFTKRVLVENTLAVTFVKNPGFCPLSVDAYGF